MIVLSIGKIRLVWGRAGDILIVFEDAEEMADMTSILSHDCSTGENGNGRKKCSLIEKS